MAYKKQGFYDGMILEAKHLIAMEEGIIDSITKNSSRATEVNFSDFESSGSIVETCKDGSTITYTVTSDADGNPVKITDSNGNETVLTW